MCAMHLHVYTLRHCHTTESRARVWYHILPKQFMYPRTLCYIALLSYYSNHRALSSQVDLELDGKIERLRDTQRKYANILRLSRMLTQHYYSVVQTQRALGDSFSELAQKSPELQEEFRYNSETQSALVRNGEVLLSKNVLFFFFFSRGQRLDEFGKGSRVCFY